MENSSLGSVGILGCGWLGIALAEELLHQGIGVKGTTTSEFKRDELEEAGIEAFRVELMSEGVIGHLNDFLKNLQVLVISIPPKFKAGDGSLLAALQYVFDFSDLSHIKRIIYVSSTGVFEDAEHCVYDEESAPNNSSAKGKYLIQLENFILSNSTEHEVCVLRFGGLLKHGGRHPIKYLAGRTNIANPDAPVNLIEQKDCVDLMVAMLKTEDIPTICHGVYPWHPSRKDYYMQKAKEQGLQLPAFNKTETSIGKTIQSENTAQHLNFKYTSKI